MEECTIAFLNQHAMRRGCSKKDMGEEKENHHKLTFHWIMKQDTHIERRLKQLDYDHFEVVSLKAKRDEMLVSIYVVDSCINMSQLF
jgi:hypothetical protein